MNRLPALIEALKAEDKLECQSILFAIGSIGPAARDALPTLLVMARERTEVRSAVFSTLGGIGAEPAKVIPLLIEGLKDPDGGVRRSAAIALGRFGADASPAAPTLVTMLNDPAITIRVAAADALWQVGKEREAAVRTMTTAIKDPLLRNRVLAARSLLKIGQHKQESLAILVDALKHETDLASFLAAVRALGDAGPNARPALPALQAATEDANEYMREHVVKALKKIAPEAATTRGK